MSIFKKKENKSENLSVRHTVDKDILINQKDGNFFGGYEEPPYLMVLCLKCGKIFRTSYFDMLANEDFKCPSCKNTDLAHAKLDGMMRVDNDKIEITKSKLSGYIEEAEDTVIQTGLMSLSNSFTEDDLVNNLYALVFDAKENKIKYWGKEEKPHTYGGGKVYLPLNADYCYMGPINEELLNPCLEKNKHHIVFWLDYDFKEMEQGTEKLKECDA